MTFNFKMFLRITEYIFDICWSIYTKNTNYANYLIYQCDSVTCHLSFVKKHTHGIDSIIIYFFLILDNVENFKPWRSTPIHLFT